MAIPPEQKTAYAASCNCSTMTPIDAATDDPGGDRRRRRPRGDHRRADEKTAHLASIDTFTWIPIDTTYNENGQPMGADRLAQLDRDHAEQRDQPTYCAFSTMASRDSVRQRRVPDGLSRPGSVFPLPVAVRDGSPVYVLEDEGAGRGRHRLEIAAEQLGKAITVDSPDADRDQPEQAAGIRRRPRLRTVTPINATTKAADTDPGRRPNISDGDQPWSGPVTGQVAEQHGGGLRRRDTSARCEAPRITRRRAPRMRGR